MPLFPYFHIYLFNFTSMYLNAATIARGNFKLLKLKLKKNYIIIFTPQ